MNESNEDYNPGNSHARSDPAWSRSLGSIVKPKKIQRIKCRKCNEMVNITGGCLMHHVNTRHLKLPLFRCTQCPKDFFEVSNTSVLKHMRLNHNSDTSFRCLFRAKEERSRIRKMKRYMEKKNAAAAHLLSGAASHPKPAVMIPSTIQRLMQETEDYQPDFPSSSSSSVMNSMPPSPYIDPYKPFPNFSAQLASLNNNNGPSAHISNEDRAQCRVCGERVWNRITNRLNHVNTRHLHIPLYQCKLCGKSFESFSRSAVYSHITFAHKEIVEDRKEAIEENIVSMKDANAERLQDECNNYFM
uniref:C2H2-type domain-containing protein n=1 Tax=Ditylenchus dipsaci TaxID=166011 RepID=A0A915ETE8_9BILA